MRPYTACVFSDETSCAICMRARGERGLLSYLAEQCDHMMFVEIDKTEGDHMLPIAFRAFPSGIYLIKGAWTNMDVCINTVIYWPTCVAFILNE